MVNFKEPINKFKLDDILQGLHPTYQTNKLKCRLLNAGIFKNVCAECNQGPEWNGKPLVLQLDHVNGISTDHRLENLRILCPHCHSQTETFTGKNKFKPRVVSVKKKIKQRKEEYLKTRLARLKTEQQRKVEMLLSSDINFQSLGWKTEAAAIIGITPQKVTQWIKRECPELLEISYQRKSSSR